MNGTAPIARAAHARCIQLEAGRTAAARSGNGGIDIDESRLGDELRRGADQQGKLEGMTEGRGDDLREGRTQRARGIDHAARVTRNSVRPAPEKWLSS